MLHLDVSGCEHVEEAVHSLQSWHHADTSLLLTALIAVYTCCKADSSLDKSNSVSELQVDVLIRETASSPLLFLLEASHSFSRVRGEMRRSTGG